MNLKKRFKKAYYLTNKNKYIKQVMKISNINNCLKDQKQSNKMKIFNKISTKMIRREKEFIKNQCLFQTKINNLKLTD